MKTKGIGKMQNTARFALPPLITLIFMLFIYKRYDMYPFGTRSLSWCDMSQQTVTLLNQFKDILDGRGSIFYSLKNSGGMNFYGVYFFFLSSPFTFLVKFIPKENVMMFCNVLVMLKMAMSALTASLCFYHCRKKLDAPSAVLLSVMYPFCGFVMMYYQNLMWLDTVYLFPLLVISLYRMTKKQKPLMYVITLSAMMLANFYICFMIVIYILLFVLVYSIKNFSGEYASRVCRDMLISSAIAALLTAWVWLPSFLDYASSGRGETGVIDTIASSDMVTNFNTVLPMLFCTAFAFVIICIDIISGRRRSVRNERTLILLGLTLIPFFVEPINKMWHTGNYMSFPCRFGFITVFLSLLCCAHALEEPVEYKFSNVRYYAASAVSLISIFCCFYYCVSVCSPENEDICSYSDTLWGNEGSFRQLLGVFIFFAAAYASAYVFYKKGYIFKKIFLSFAAMIFLIECISYTSIYMVHPAMTNADTNTAQSEVYKLSGRIDDDDFYRVKSYSKVYNNNMIGALGYNSVSHYTSLNSRDFMLTMKRLGYSGVWMETSSVGGTRLTDALLSMNYEINGGVSGEELIYEGSEGRIFKLPEYLPMGLLLEGGSLDECESFDEGLTRAQIQSVISSSIFGEDVTAEYSPDIPKEPLSDGKYAFITGERIEYHIDIKDEQTVYLDCYDGFSNHLTEPIFDTFSVTVNGNTVKPSYPINTDNGVLRLGDYSNTTLEITLDCNKNIECASFGVFGIDTGRLQELCENAGAPGAKSSR